MPKLTCNITGHSYYVTNEQLEAKAKALELPIEEFLKVYVSKKISSLLQKGHSIDDIRHLVDCADELPILNESQREQISSLYVQSNARKVLSNFTTIASLAVDESDPTVTEYISFLKFK